MLAEENFDAFSFCGRDYVSYAGLEVQTKLRGVCHFIIEDEHLSMSAHLNKKEILGLIQHLALVADVDLKYFNTEDLEIARQMRDNLS